MPILRKEGQKIYFAHVPKTAGSSLYLSLLSSGYSMSNFGPRTGDLKPGGVAGTAQQVFERFGIRCFQKEGDLNHLQSTLQHATADIWQGWGPFDWSFAVIREPMRRFESAAIFRYRAIARRKGLRHSDRLFDRFQRSLLSRLSNSQEDPAFFDNHFRPASHFLAPDTKLYVLEEGGLDQLAYDLGLEKMERQNARSRDLELCTELKVAARRHYREDIAFYEAVRSTRTC